MNWDEDLNKVPLGITDPILELNERCKADPYKEKINVGIGAYRDNESLPVVLECVKRAETEFLPKVYPYKEYPSMEGLPEFLLASKRLIYGNQIPDEKTLSGTGAMHIGAAFLSTSCSSFINQTALIPKPTWGNHLKIFPACGIKVEQYPYYDSESIKLNENAIYEALQNAPLKSIAVLHACAHNPTGIDPTLEQWKRIHQIIKEKKHVSFFDLAYQGFASGDVEEDIKAVRLFLNDPPGPILIGQSYAKNMGLYGERIGSFSILCSSKQQKEAIMSQLKILTRREYSFPPIHGARLVSLVLGNPELESKWHEELKVMTGRIKEMRISLRKALEEFVPSRKWDHMTNQIGMFCYTGLSPEQCDELVSNHHVYMTRDGRISMTGVTTANVNKLASTIAKVIAKIP